MSLQGNFSLLNSSSTQNNTKVSNLTLGWRVQEHLAITITKYFILCSIMIVGIAGNILVILVSTKRKAFKSSLDLYLKNLAAADLGFLLLVIPAAVIRSEIPFGWPLGGFICRYVWPLVEIFHGASVWIIVAVAAERYRNIVGMVHVQRRRYSGGKQVMITITLAWVISFVVFCIPELAMVTYIETPRYKICTLDFPDPDGKQAAVQFYLWFMTAFSYIIPFIGIIWTYIAISRQLNRSNTFLRSLKNLIQKKSSRKYYSGPAGRRTLTSEGLVTRSRSSVDEAQTKSLSDGRRLTQNKRAKKILTPVAITFAITMLPLNMMRITVLYWRDFVNQTYYPILFFVTIIFTAAYASLNPALYSIVSADFRSSLRSLFRKSVDRIRSITTSSFAREMGHSTTILAPMNGAALLGGADRRCSALSESTRC
ncbi:predicted protein [Nematostella vectensis]|uniref:G-protein coupled receptors family 1 profile domain-containing protein n=1 Tax=Nematostella vectensis TaxID=45351 RepID=A7S5U1_NEMVE|nr:predicted protein [Nematostella vectensis]|eukprot:XP_001633027.1 predicted protein [Nematostella vectensis]